MWLSGLNTTYYIEEVSLQLASILMDKGFGLIMSGGTYTRRAYKAIYDRQDCGIKHPVF